MVFDTETTGLHPNRGDEIVQIAAVRIVAGRLLTDDRFETLVHRERPIPAVSTEIHGVTAAMVAGAPTIDEAGRRFHAYCGDSVLIAHNAPFDLAFLKRHAGRIGATLDHPVLDTALMSAILFGAGASHNLDAIAERLGGPIGRLRGYRPERRQGRGRGAKRPGRGGGPGARRPPAGGVGARGRRPAAKRSARRPGSTLWPRGCRSRYEVMT